MNIKNYTPHVIVILDDNDNEKTFIPSDGNIRIAETVETVETLPNGIKLKRKLYSRPDYLPPQTEGVIYIVSMVVCNVCTDRQDFYVPFEMKKVRGISMGCKALCKNPFAN